MVFEFDHHVAHAVLRRGGGLRPFDLLVSHQELFERLGELLLDLFARGAGIDAHHHALADRVFRELLLGNMHQPVNTEGEQAAHDEKGDAEIAHRPRYYIAFTSLADFLHPVGHDAVARLYSCGDRDGVVHQASRGDSRADDRIPAHFPYEAASVAGLLHGAYRQRDLFGRPCRRCLHAAYHAREQLAVGVGQRGAYVIGVCGGVCHGTLFDLPGRESTVAECRDGYPQPAVRAQACDLLLGYREADFHHPDPQQGHGRDARQNRLPRCGLPFADDAREGRVQLAVVEVFAGDAVWAFFGEVQPVANSSIAQKVVCFISSVFFDAKLPF